MVKRFFAIFISCLYLIFCGPVYSKEVPQKSLEKYINKISNKFSKTYCNTSKFGISNEGALAFAIGETNKEFRKNQLNYLIDYSLLRDKIVNNLEINCQVYDFPIDSLEKLEFG